MRIIVEHGQTDPAPVVVTRTEEPVYRHEYKSLVSNAQLVILQTRIQGLMPPDPHAQYGHYNIRSLYFDDYHNSCYYANEFGLDHRAKYRIRIYNHSAERIQLELKRKDRGKTLKSACRITRSQAENLISGQPIRDASPNQTLLRDFRAAMLSAKLHPAVIVEYERFPFIYRAGNVRATFDTSVSSSSDFQSFFQPRINKRPILPAGMQLLEVKFDAFLPDAVYHSLQLDNLWQTAFSKYYLCRKYAL